MYRQTELLQAFLDEWHSGNGITARTSGSTGTPKTILLPLAQVERSARRTNLFFRINRRSRLHSAVSFEFIGGKMMIARSLISGCDLTFSEPSLLPSPPEEGRRVSLMSVVPAQMAYILDNKEAFFNVERFLIGGSAIDARLWERIVSSGIQVWESYGMTETASHIAVRRIAGHADRRPRFVPFSGVRIFLDPDNCIHVVDDDVVVTTNDIARVYPDGSFEILGRRDDIIVTGGLKVLPQDIERILKPRLDALCSDFFISSLPDEIWTSRIVLVCVPKTIDCREGDFGLKKTLTASLRHIVDAVPLDILPKRMRPKDIIIAPELPMTQSGKLLRRLPPGFGNRES